MNDRRRPHWLLIAATLLIAMGHVCALPGHAHTAGGATDHEIEAHHHPAPAAHQRPAPADDESHLESCEGLRSAAAKLLIVPVALPDPATLTVDARAARPQHRPSFVAASPPLFLLHASLRI